MAGLGLVGALVSPWGKESVDVVAAVRAEAKPTPPPVRLDGLDLRRITTSEAGVSAPLPNGRRAELTLNATEQAAAMRLLKEGRVPDGAIVMSDVRTGEMRVWASVSSAEPPVDTVTSAEAPSASLFKVVTGLALLEEGAAGPGTSTCYHGGHSALTLKDLQNNPKVDRYCATLSQAMGRSLNAVFAKLALAHLEPGELKRVADRFGYNQEHSFDVPVAKSDAFFPADDLGFGRTAAGFWNTHLSPFHALTMFDTVANAGEMRKLRIVRAVHEGSQELWRAPTERVVLRRVMEPNTATQITFMLNETVDAGTGYKAFHPRGKAALPKIRVASKTGTLTKPTPEGPFYTWFAGFAPSDAPEVAFAVLAANGPKWHTKAANLASDMLRVYFAERGAPGVTNPMNTAPKARRVARATGKASAKR